MKQNLKLFTYLLLCSAFIIAALNAGKDAYSDCDKCHYFTNGYHIAQPDPFLHALHKTQLTKN